MTEYNLLELETDIIHGMIYPSDTLCNTHTNYDGDWEIVLNSITCAKCLKEIEENHE